MNTNEKMRREIVSVLDEGRPAFDALIDQVVCQIRDTSCVADRSISITEFSVAFSNLAQWNDILGLVRQRLTIPPDELHRVFLAYLMAVCLNRLAWP